MEPLVGRNIDRYVVEKLLGRGAMAAVYRVRHRTLNTLHALKVLTLAGDRVRERLVQEGQVQAQLRHPNVLSVTDVLDVDGAPGLLMEFIDGPTLEDYAQVNRPTIEQAESLFRGVLLGVAEAHSIGLVHRDLKPANVLVASSSRGPVPKVADFGLAKLLADEESGGGMHRTRSGSTMGTPAYMAPEQIRDAKHVDHRADIFSLGAILYELVAGRRPFDGEDILAVFNAVASGAYLPLVGVPDRIVLAVSGALIVKRDDRIPDCDTLIDVLDGKRTSWADVTLRRRVHSFGGPSSGGPNSVGPSSVSASPSGAAVGAQVAAARPEPISLAGALAGSATLDPSSFSGDDGAQVADSLATIDPAADNLAPNSAWQPAGLSATQAQPATHVPPATLESVPPQTAETLAPPVATRASAIAESALPTHHVQFGAGQGANSPPTVSAPEGTEVHVVGKTEGKAGQSGAWIMVLRTGGVVSIAVVAALALLFVYPAMQPGSEPTDALAAAEVAATDAGTPPQADAGEAAKAESPKLIASAAPPADAVASGGSASPQPAAAPAPVVAKAAVDVAAKPATTAKSGTKPVGSPTATEPVAVVAAPAAEKSELIVSSVSLPVAKLSIDGVPAGKSNTRHLLPVGKHSVTLTTEDGKTITRSVTVPAGKAGYFCWDFEINAECAN